MKRRQFAQLAGTAFAAAAVCPATLFAASDSKTMHLAIPIRLGENTTIDVQSSAVAWRRAEVRLVRLNEIEFRLDEETNRLTAQLRGRILTFDEVNYDVGVAVIDADGHLRGVASAQCKVPRFWAGRCGTQPVELSLDFGVSKDYADRPLSFLVSVSNRRVLTPEQWETSE